MEKQEEKQEKEDLSQFGLQFETDEDIKKEPVGMFLNKHEFYENPRVVTPLGLAKQPHNFRENAVQHVLAVRHDGTEYLINISKSNRNALIDMLGIRTSEWKTKYTNKLRISAAPFNDFENAYTLVFELV